MVLSSSIRMPHGSNKHSEHVNSQPSSQQSQELQWLVRHLRHAPLKDFAPEMVPVIRNTRASNEEIQEFIETVVASLPEFAKEISGCFPGESEEWYTHFTVWFVACKLFGNDIEYPFKPPMKEITPKDVFTAKCAKEFLRVVYTDSMPECRNDKPVKPVKSINNEARLSNYSKMKAPEIHQSGPEYEVLRLRRELVRKNEEITALKEEVKRKTKHVSTLLNALQTATK